MGVKLYECGICSSLHPWAWQGDCREDANRYADEVDYAERNGLTRAECFAIEVMIWAERLEADTCACFYDCREDSHSGEWHQHESDPCPVHPTARTVG